MEPKDKAIPGMDLQPHLQGPLIEVRPLHTDDFQALYIVASDPLIWEQHPAKNRHEPQEFQLFFDDAIESGGALTVTNVDSDEIIGTTRYHGYDYENSVIEIGWTFLARSCWGGTYNRELKELTVVHALQYVRTVEFLIGKDNIRSQRSVEKIGAELVGERRKDDGSEMLVFTINRQTMLF